MIRGTLSFVVATAGLASLASANTILYSSFEGVAPMQMGTLGDLGPFDASGPGYAQYNGGRTLNDNGVLWAVGGNGVDQIQDAYAPFPFPPFPNSSHFALDMNALDPGSITTSVTTVIGQQYEMSFWLSVNGSGSFTATLSAVPGAMIYTGDAHWVQEFVDFTATSTSTIVSFASTGPSGSAGPALDEVRIQTVPIPAAAYAALSSLAGVAGLGVIRRRRLTRA